MRGLNYVWSVAVRYRIGENREVVKVAIGLRWGRVKVKMIKMIYFEDRISDALTAEAFLFSRVIGGKDGSDRDIIPK